MIYLFVFAHLVADFILQPYILVQRKRHWDGLLIHGGIVLLCMLMLPLFDRQVSALWPQMLLITAIHIVADRWKVQHGDHTFRHPIGPFLLDQAIHVSTLIGVLELTLPARQVWMSSSSPFAALAVYGSVYTIAAFAAPIGVMIWLDPAFQHTALAGRARLHSMLAGTAVVTMMLLGGIFALPMILVVLAYLLRRPLSPHPLDTMQGMLIVACVAAVSASILILMQIH